MKRTSTRAAAAARTAARVLAEAAGHVSSGSREASRDLREYARLRAAGWTLVLVDGVEQWTRDGVTCDRAVALAEVER